MTEGNKYLAQIVIRGIKGNFKPILGWYQEVYANSKRLTNLVEAETPQSTTAKMVLNTLKPGFYSKNPDVAYWACKLFAKIAHDFQVLELFNVNWDWFLAKDGGLDCIVYTITKHPQKIHTIFDVMLNFAHNNLYTLLVENVKLNYIDGNEYMGFVVRIIEPLFKAKIKNEDLVYALLHYWMEYCSKFAENDGRHTPDERANALGRVTLHLFFNFFARYSLRNLEILPQNH